jgi:gas vesicle protein
MKTSLMFLLGVGMGTVLGLLLAPEAGKITRRKIREEADRFIDRALAKKELKKLQAEGIVTTTHVEPVGRYTLS